MEDVTDFVFREIIAETAPPDVFFTEFTNVAGLMSEGRDHVAKRLEYSEKQRPIVAQIWGTDPKNYYHGAKYVKSLGFDGIDINMGCPQRSVIKNGGGAVLIKTRNLAQEIVDATKKGGQDLPVSVKTRLGYRQIETENWAEFLLKQGVAALTMHGRTQKQMSKTPANWDEIGKIPAIRNRIAPDTLIIGNGDIESYGEALEKSEKYKVDGVMIGRGIFSNPWIFEKQQKEHSTHENLKLLLKHAKLFEEKWGSKKNFHIMRKFLKTYVREFPDATVLREKLMKCNSYNEIKETLDNFDFGNTNS